MNIAFCFESVLPTRGGCETYIADLARRLVADHHHVHLYASRWDAQALPAALCDHHVPPTRGPRFLRPWRFGAACEAALRQAEHNVSVGFDKTWGQDVLYPQGGLHAATIAHNLNKYASPLNRELARLGRYLDPAYWSFARLERKQYLGPHRPLVIVNSRMVQRHFGEYYGISADDLRVVRSAIDLGRFNEQDRPKRRLAFRESHGIGPEVTVALFAAMNFRLKGLEPLLHAVRLLPGQRPFQLLVVGNPHAGGYERLARRLGIAKRVQFLGHQGDMRSVYFAAEFLVHPTFYDPCSLVVLEALACGLPVITTRYNGVTELLSPLSEGYVINDPHDHAHLSWCMEQLLDPIRRQSCAQAARRASQQWTFEHHYRQLLQVFDEAAARKQAA